MREDTGTGIVGDHLSSPEGNYFIRRPRLFEQYNQTDNWKITIIMAPPGSGKSAIMHEWKTYYEEKSPGSSCLVSLDISEAELVKAFEKIEKIVDEELKAEHEHSDKVSPVYFLIDGFEWLNEEMQLPLFYRLVKRSPRHCHFVLSGSLFPNRLYVELAGYNIQSVPTSSLMMTYEETVQFLTDNCPEVPETIVSAEHIHWVTEGWPMGLRLLVQSYEKYPQSAMFEEFDENNELIDVFFRTQVFDNLPRDLVSFSYETSIADVLNPSLCDCITGQNNSVSLLERLSELNPFLYKLNNKGEYRYHRLYARWLRAQLLQFTNSQIRKLSTNASMWYSKNKDATKKAVMLLLATDATCLVPLFKKTPFEGKIADSAELFLDTLSQRPENLSEKNVHFCFLIVWVYIGFGQYEEITYWAKALKKAMNETPLEEELRNYYNLTIEVANAVCHSILFHNRESIIQCTNILDSDNPDLNPIVKFHLYYSLADDYERIGNNSAAIDCCLEANAYAMACGATDMATFPNYKRCSIMLPQGRFSEVKALAETSIPLTNEDSPFRRAFFVQLALTQIEALAIEDSRRNIRRGLTDLVYLKNPEVYIEAQLAQIDCYIAEGELESAHELVVKTINMFTGQNIPAAAMGFAYIAMGQISILRESSMGLRECCRKLASNIFADDYFFTLYLIYFKAALSYQEGGIEEALELLDEVCDKAKKADQNTLFLEAAFRKALILEAKDRLDEAIPFLREALTVGMNCGYMMTILCSGKGISVLLRAFRDEARESMRLNEYVKNLIQVLASREKEAQPEESTLTPRELEILKMLNAGKTRQQISDTLFISLNTTKTHIKNIRRKLNG